MFWYYIQDMFRTRDFFLFSVIIVLLLLVILTTLNAQKEVGWWHNMTFINNDVEYEAVVPKVAVMDREKKLTEMQDKISESARSGNLAIVIGALEEEKSTEDQMPEEENDFVVGTINLCSSYSDYSPTWLPTDLKFEIIEGARIVYRDLAVADMAIDPNSSIMTTNREIVMQLPLRSASANVKKCLSSAVVGIALDGSLINNSDYTAYKVFGAETLIGYALDGFPIYGLNTVTKTDQCGGVNQDGQYKYYLSNDREGILGCFSSEPINL